MESILKTWFQMLFYSVTIPLTLCVLEKNQITAKGLLATLFPVTSETWDFASAYVVLMLFVPFYNRLLQGLNKSEYKMLLVLFFFCWCLIPTLTGKDFESNYLIWMFVVYAVGAYIRLYPHWITEAVKPALIGLIVSFLSYLLSVIFLDILGVHFSFFANSAREIRFGQMKMLPCVLLSISLFLLFKNLKITNCKAINFLARGVFGVYLIHEHSLVRDLLWNHLFQNTRQFEDPKLPLHALFAVVTVFLCCEIIELIRIYLLEKNYMRLIHSLCTRIKSKYTFWEQPG